MAAMMPLLAGSFTAILLGERDVGDHKYLYPARVTSGDAPSAQDDVCGNC